MPSSSSTSRRVAMIREYAGESRQTPWGVPQG
jgi:hypothetical protein